MYLKFVELDASSGRPGLNEYRFDAATVGFSMHKREYGVPFMSSAGLRIGRLSEGKPGAGES
jgi:hypothetical protein